ncbi:MAG: hypothetical protein ACTSO7_18980, partial [Candidatus Heimdallarchaeota archaeon]
ILMGKADPHMDFYLSPKEIVKTEKETEMTLSINNTAYFDYQLNISKVELIGSARSFYELENHTQENIKLKTNEFLSIPIKLNKTSTSKELPIEKIEVKLTGTTPVYNLFFEQGHNYTFPFEVFFEITLTEPTTTNPTNDNKEKIKTGVIIGAAILTGVSIGAVSIYLVKKRRKNKKLI